MPDLFDGDVPHPVYSITRCIIEPHAPYTVPLVVEHYVPQVASVTLKYLSATGFPATVLQPLSSQWRFTSKALVQNIKKGMPQTLFLCFKDCDFVKLDPVVYSGESHWLQHNV